jgi:hypothetical protein
MIVFAFFFTDTLWRATEMPRDKHFFGDGKSLGFRNAGRLAHFFWSLSIVSNSDVNLDLCRRLNLSKSKTSKHFQPPGA